MNWQNITMIVSLLVITLAAAIVGHLLGFGDLRTAGCAGFTASLGFLLGRWQIGNGSKAIFLVAALGAAVGSGGCGPVCRMDPACTARAAMTCMGELNKCCITADAWEDEP